MTEKTVRTHAFNHSSTDKELETPFENIALAFSGGGYRAASFALGVLSYLNELKPDEGPQTLLEKVSYISSASGGTIASAMYSLYNAKGKPFATFYKALFEEMEGVKLLDRVFEILNNDTEWKKRQPKTRNIINAFAIAYDEKIFNGAMVSDLSPGTATHLDEVCFNTTDFYRGLLFRQAIKMKEDPKEDKSFLYGNFIAHLKRGDELKLKLGDLLAASSCFPAGFEPIIFPTDFQSDNQNMCIAPQELSWDELNILYDKSTIDNVINKLPKPIVIKSFVEAIKKEKFKSDFKIGLMDGGITDNQGIESMMRANDRRLKDETSFKSFDFMLVNDVGSHFMDPYQLPYTAKIDKGINSLNIKTVIIIAVIAALLSAGGIVYSFFPGTLCFSVLLTMLCTIILLVSAGTLALLFTLKRFISSKLNNGGGLNLYKNFSPEITKRLFRFFSKTPIGVIMLMLKERVSSVLTLNSDVFLKRIRQLLYQQFFETGKWKYRVKSNHVYDLSFTNDVNFLQNGTASLKPGDNIQIVAEAAFEMATTLWFDTRSQEDHSQAAVIACGQFTTCYNMLEYVQRLRGSDVFAHLSEFYKERVNRLEKKLQDDYKYFQDNPFILYNKLGKDYNINGFKPCKMDMPPFNKIPERFKDLRS